MTVHVPLGSLYAFLLVLARVSGFLAFLPLPGLRVIPDQMRVMLALAVTFALVPFWPALPPVPPTAGQLAAWAFLEAGLGLAIGVAVTFLTESFQLASQVLGLQAGYGYATTIDPNSQADAGMLQVITALMSGLLFLALGLDRELFRVLAASFGKFPAGAWAPSLMNLEAVAGLGSSMFSLGLRLAFPVVALLLLLDISLAALGRVQQQLQLLSLAFPLKMLAALAVMAALAPAFARLFEDSARRTLAVLWRSLAA